MVLLFLFFFLKELLETFISDIGTGLSVGVGLGFQSPLQKVIRLKMYQCQLSEQ